MAKTFAAQLADIRGLTVKRIEAVAKQSIQDVVDDMQTPKAKGGRMPVDTGFLLNSLVSGLDGSFGPPGADSYTGVIAGMEIGDVVRFAYTAEYAVHQELGTSRFAGNHFMGAAAAKWPAFVAANAARARG